MPDPLTRKPWPMRWVVLAIIACVIPYTWITIAYRKSTPAYQPYEDSKQRANVLRLLDAGYRRIDAAVDRPADPEVNVRQMSALAGSVSTPGGLPRELAETLVESPRLPLSFSEVSAPGEHAGLLPYPIVFICALADRKQQLGGAQVFIKESTIVIAPQFEPLSDELSARSKEAPVMLTVPGGALKPGTYNVLLAGETQSRQWTLQVR